MKDKLNEFFASSLRSKWLRSEEICVYVRKGRHLGTDRQIHSYLDIANVYVDPKYRHQGHFKAFLALCQQLQPYDGILVEIVLDEDLRAYLRRLAQQDTRWTERGEDFLWEKYGAGGET